MSISIPELSFGALTQMLNNTEKETKILQILDFDDNYGPNGYYFANINDGITQYDCVLNPNSLQSLNNHFDKYCLIEVKDYLVHNKHNNTDEPFLIIHDFRLLIAGNVQYIC